MSAMAIDDLVNDIREAMARSFAKVYSEWRDEQLMTGDGGDLPSGVKWPTPRAHFATPDDMRREEMIFPLGRRPSRLLAGLNLAPIQRPEISILEERLI